MLSGRVQDLAVLAAENYPLPVDHCDVCRWRVECDGRRHADDQLSLTAGIPRLQIQELEFVGQVNDNSTLLIN
jgi:predicted RecB family nuclease